MIKINPKKQMNINIETIDDLIKLGLDFCREHKFDPGRANLAHDGCHVVSGYPASKEGEELQAGWELAIMDVNPKNHLSDLKIEGYLAGCEFADKNPRIAKLLSFALQNV